MYVKVACRDGKIKALLLGEGDTMSLSSLKSVALGATNVVIDMCGDYPVAGDIQGDRISAPPGGWKNNESYKIIYEEEAENENKNNENENENKVKQSEKIKEMKKLVAAKFAEKPEHLAVVSSWLGEDESKVEVLSDEVLEMVKKEEMMKKDVKWFLDTVKGSNGKTFLEGVVAAIKHSQKVNSNCTFCLPLTTR